MVSEKQIEWLKSRIAELQLPTGKRDHDTREKWLLECGMPDALSTDAETVASQIADTVLSWMVKYDLLDAGNEYQASDVLDVLNDLVPKCHASDAIGWWYQDSTGCIHMSLDMELGKRHERETGHALNLMYGKPLPAEPVTAPPQTHVGRDAAPLTISHTVHEIAHNVLIAHTGNEGGSPKINWYKLRREISDAIAAALNNQRQIDIQPAHHASGAIAAIDAERQRQIAKGYDAAHDDSHKGGEIILSEWGARARIEAAINAGRSGDSPAYKELLTEAAAQCAAEIERVDRAALEASEGQPDGN